MNKYIAIFIFLVSAPLFGQNIIGHVFYKDPATFTLMPWESEAIYLAGEKIAIESTSILPKFSLLKDDRFLWEIERDINLRILVDIWISKNRYIIKIGTNYKIGIINDRVFILDKKMISFIAGLFVDKYRNEILRYYLK